MDTTAASPRTDRLGQARYGLATLLAIITPAVLWFVIDLYLSGAAYNADGGRDLIRQEKIAGPGAIFTVLLSTGGPTFVAGLACLALARTVGRITASRLVLLASVGAGLVALAATVVLSAIDGGFQAEYLLGSLFLAALAGAIAALFALVAGLPLRVTSVARPASRRTKIVVVAIAGLAAAGTLCWLGSLAVWGLAHPCRSCG